MHAPIILSGKKYVRNKVHTDSKYVVMSFFSSKVSIA